MSDAVSARPLELPLWPRKAVLRLNALQRWLDVRADAELRALGERLGSVLGVSVSCQQTPHARVVRRSAETAAAFELVFARGSERFVVALERELAREIAALSVSAEERSVRAPLPLSALEQGLCAYALYRAIAAWPLGEGLAIAGNREHEGNAWGVEVEASVRIGARTGRGSLFLPFECWPSFDAPRKAAAWPGPLAQCEVELRARLASRAVPRRDLARVEPGGFVIFPALDDWQRVSVLVESRVAPLFAGRWDGVTIRLEERSMERTSREETPEGDGSIAALDELELEVEAVVGSCRVSLDELRRLGPGQALSLQRPADGTVEIRVQRRKVGEGELIDVDGVLAVRLTRWEGERS